MALSRGAVASDVERLTINFLRSCLGWRPEDFQTSHDEGAIMNATEELPKVKRTKRRYRLLAGQHIENHPSGKKYPDGSPVEIVFKQGDVFESELFLERLNPHHSNGQPNLDMLPKFELIHEIQTSPPPPDMTQQQQNETRKQYAERLAVLLKQATEDEVPAQAQTKTVQPQTSSKLTEIQLKAKSLKELEEICEAEEIDLSKLSPKTKEGIIRIILTSIG